MYRIRIASRAFCLAAVLAVIGCGGDKAVTGKLVKNGTAYTPASGERLVVLLTSPQGAQYSAEVPEKSDTFRIIASRDRPIPAGQYKVSVTRYPPGAIKRPPAPQDTGVVWDVGGPAGERTLDISKVK